VHQRSRTIVIVNVVVIVVIIIVVVAAALAAVPAPLPLLLVLARVVVLVLFVCEGGGRVQGWVAISARRVGEARIGGGWPGAQGVWARRGLVAGGQAHTRRQAGEA
jgi:hypothetical protein